MNEVAVIPPKPLTVIERAAAVFAAVPSEEDLRELAKKSVTITEITNEAGKDQCHASRMVLKNTRLEIERVGEDGREDAVQTSKAIIARQKALIGITKPEEDRLAAIQKTWDDRIAAEKEAKIQAEIARVAEIQRLIDDIRNWPVNAAGKPSALVNQMLQSATDYQVEEEVFQERTEEAKTILIASTAALQGIYQERLTHEAAQEQLKRDQEELARLRAEQAERDRLGREAQAKADANAKAERDRLEAIAKAERDAQAKAQADARAAQEAIDKANRERNEMALQEIQAIHHQLIIADTGRAPYCKGGDLESIDWVIEGTERWEITEERFGALFAAAVKTKETTLLALQAKRVDFIARQENEAERQRQADEAGRLTAAREQLAKEQAALAEAQKPKTELPPLPKARPFMAKTPSREEIIAAVATHFNVETGIAQYWLSAIRWDRAA